MMRICEGLILTGIHEGKPCITRACVVRHDRLYCRMHDPVGFAQRRIYVGRECHVYIGLPLRDAKALKKFLEKHRLFPRVREMLNQSLAARTYRLHFNQRRRT